MAQAVGAATHCCLKIKQELSAVAGSVDPTKIETETFGTARMLVDADRLSGNQAIQTVNDKGRPQAGANKLVQVSFTPPTCGEADDAVDIMDGTCTTGTPTLVPEQVDNAYVDDFINATFSISAYMADDVCETVPGQLEYRMREVARKMMKSYNKKLAIKLGAGVGNYFKDASDPTPAVSSATNPKSLKLFDANNDPQPGGFYPMMHQYTRMGMDGVKPLAVSSSGKWGFYEYAKSFYGGNTCGVDPRDGLQFMPYMDYELDNVLEASGLYAGNGAQRVISIIPQAVKLLNWYKFENDKIQTAGAHPIFRPVQIDGELVRQKIDIGTPYFGIPLVVDMEIHWDKCSNTVTYKFQKYFDLWKIPQAAFTTDCNQYHNYCLLWDVAPCADLTCDEISGK